MAPAVGFTASWATPPASPTRWETSPVLHLQTMVAEANEQPGIVRGMDNNVLTQIGFIVLIGLACKNTILIVEFAKAEEEAGKDRFQAAIDAWRLRLRPILMTALSFILGVVPLLIATGAGFEMRRALGAAVFSGMIGVTLCGLFLTPVFDVVLRRFARSSSKHVTG